MPGGSRKGVAARHDGRMDDNTHLLAGRRVHSMGFGAMQLPGPGVFGPPRDRQQALDVLRRSTGRCRPHRYRPVLWADVANELIAKRSIPTRKRWCWYRRWVPDAILGRLAGAQRPEELREGVLANLASLQVDQVPVVNLRRHPSPMCPSTNRWRRWWPYTTRD